MTDPVVRTPPATRGISQAELTGLGSLLRELGFSQDGVDRITNELQQIAAQSAFQGTTSVAMSIQKLRADEQAYWSTYTNNTLLNVLNQLRASQNAFGYVSVTTVIATIQAAMLGIANVNNPDSRRPAQPIRAIVN